MSFHIEHRLDNRHQRTGTFASRGEAVLAALRLKTTPVLIIEGDDSVSPGDGAVVAVVLKRGEVVTAGAEPAWWSSISEPSRKKLLAGGQLDTDVVTDVTDAGGGVAATAWERGPMDEWELTPAADHNWVRVEAARRDVQR
jgi:hypothetical protein